jgi:hypothetical protein
LTKLTQGAPFTIERIRVNAKNIALEGMFGVSYPTVKNRLNANAGQLEFVEINPPASKIDILTELERGAIEVEEALDKLRDSP